MTGQRLAIPAGIAGASAGPRVHEVDARWLMAYAAALDDAAPEYMDTTRSGGIVGHPLFPVCYEWALALDLRARTMPEEVALRGVHATHDLRLHRRPRPGDRLSTRATVVSTRHIGPGAYVITRFETADAEGRPVSTTDYGSIYRGVDCEPAAVDPGHAGAAVSSDRAEGRGAAACASGAAARETPPRAGDPPASKDSAARPALEVDPAVAPDWSVEIGVSATLAHVYTECARIWNPIHTDRAVAREAGLPDIILHGTAILALAVSEVLRRQPGGAATPVRRIACRFRGMVRLPSTLVVEARDLEPAAAGRSIAFRAVTPEGRLAIDRGCLALGDER